MQKSPYEKTSEDLSPMPTDKSVQPPRKRNRTTPEQLSVLEDTFVHTQTPNAALRDKLGKELGMSERAVQVWFQNRRAKSKLLQKRASVGDLPGSNYSIFPIIHFSCQTLSIGGWKRIIQTKADLECRADLFHKTFNWELEESGMMFRISFPIEAVTSLVLEEPVLNQGKLTISIRKVPDFFIKQQPTDLSPDRALLSNPVYWQLCQDFTEGKQASTCFEHVIAGNYTNLQTELGRLLEAAPHLRQLTSLFSKKRELLSNWSRRGSVPCIGNSENGANFGLLSAPSLASNLLRRRSVMSATSSPLSNWSPSLHPITTNIEPVHDLSILSALNPLTPQLKSGETEQSALLATLTNGLVLSPQSALTEYLDPNGLPMPPSSFSLDSFGLNSNSSEDLVESLLQFEPDSRKGSIDVATILQHLAAPEMSKMDQTEQNPVKIVFNDS